MKAFWKSFLLLVVGASLFFGLYLFSQCSTMFTQSKQAYGSVPGESVVVNNAVVLYSYQHELLTLYIMDYDFKQMQ